MAANDPFSALNPVIPDTAARSEATGSLRGKDAAAQRTQMKQLAQEFEAMLMNEMLADWRSSLLADEDESEEGMAGMSTMTDMVGSEFGRALSRSGGLGIAEVLMRSFERQLAGQQEVAGAVAPPATTAAGPPASLVEVARAARASFETANAPVAVPVTSGFGWRPDPFTGQTKFHAGLDLRMAYGQDVKSLDAGTVTFAGEQGGYGLTVVVDHGAGRQTRYAHLSSIDVQPGAVVSSGQRIARSGNSGRSTGPHLHVELLSGGKPVDPSGLLKRTVGDADWTAYGTPSSRATE